MTTLAACAAKYLEVYPVSDLDVVTRVARRIGYTDMRLALARQMGDSTPHPSGPTKEIEKNGGIVELLSRLSS